MSRAPRLHTAHAAPAAPTFIRCAMVLLICVTASTAGVAADWTSLFNGHDLTGWQVVGEDQECWSVTDGLLHPTREGGWLSTTNQYANFEMSLEYLMPPGGNSGIFLRAPHMGQSSRKGMEIQLIDDFTDAFGALEPWQLTGSLYHVEAAKSGAVKQAGQWQSITLKADGRRLTVVLNEKTILDVDLDAYPELEAEHTGLKRNTGYIGLQNYGGRDIKFRNIRLREL